MSETSESRSISAEEEFSLELDRFVKHTNEKMLSLSKQAESFNIALDFGLFYTTLGNQMKVAKEYEVGPGEDESPQE